MELAMNSKPKTITFIANENTMGDGSNLSTMDRPRFGGSDKQYPWLSITIPKLIERGYEVEVVDWQDKKVDWKNKECLVMGPIWGYFDQKDAFGEWVERMRHGGVKIHNSVEFIEWNFKKDYLSQLQEARITVPRTEIIAETSQETLADILKKEEWQGKDVIIKGVVDAAGKGYYHVSPENMDEAEAKFSELKQQKGGAVIQQFLPEIQKQGELSLVFFGDTLSHSFVKVAAGGQERVQPFYGGKSFHIKQNDIEGSLAEIAASGHREDLTLTKQEVDTAQTQAMKLKKQLNEFFDNNNIPRPLYMRLDGVMVNDKFTLMEVEGLEPYMEMSEAMQNDPSNDVVGKYADAIEAAYQSKTQSTTTSQSPAKTRNR